MGLVLAQNFTDLCDVDIVNATNGQIVQYNGSHWVNIDDSVINSITSNDNNTLGVSPTTGNVVLYPTLKKLCEFNGVGGETGMTCSLSSPQQVLYIQMHYNSSFGGSGVWAVRFNNDSSVNYALRSSTNGAADATAGNQVFLSSRAVTTPPPIVSYFLECHNHSPSMEKWCYGNRMSFNSGVASIPGRIEMAGKWGDTTNNITSIDLVRTSGTDTLFAGSHIIVWGYS